MCAEKEQHDRNAEKELLGRGVLCAIVNLFPHVQVVKSTTIEFKWYTTDIMEHDVRAKHVCHVGQSPRRLLRDTGDNIVENFQRCDENNVDSPSS